MRIFPIFRKLYAAEMRGQKMLDLYNRYKSTELTGARLVSKL